VPRKSAKERCVSYKKVPVGNKPPHEVNVIVENPVGGPPTKYELDKKSGLLFVDRFLNTAMRYPGNYGFIPHTLSADGDPVDVIVIDPTPVMPGAVLPVNPVGVLIMEDDKGQDEKILAVPIEALNPYHRNVNDLQDVNPVMRDQIEHFFKHYKDLEKGKWSKVIGWGDAAQARQLINEGIERARKAEPAKKPGKKSPPSGPSAT